MLFFIHVLPYLYLKDELNYGLSEKNALWCEKIKVLLRIKPKLLSFLYMGLYYYAIYNQ